MIGRLLKSRGARKFRRNRLAMLSLVVIAMYVFLSAFVIITNTVNDYVAPGALEGRPVSGLLLTSQTRDKFGPREMPGFGLAGTTNQRYEAGVFYLDIADNAFRDIDRLNGESTRTPDDVLADYAVSGRPFAERSIDELREITARARAQADRVLDVRRKGGAIELIPVLAGRLEESKAALAGMIDAGNANSEDAEFALEDISFRLEEIAEQVEAYNATSERSSMERVDVNAILEAADAIFDIEEVTTADVYDPSIITGVLDAADEARETMDADLAAEVDALAPIVDELFPQPEGIAKLMNSLRLSLGTDRQGRSILIRALYSAKIALQVGVVTALIAVGFGSILGAAGAFFGGFVDHGVNWLYSMFTSIPYLVLLAVLAMLFIGSPFEGTLIPLYVAFALTYWIGPCRVIRGESMKIKELEYVQAATAIGFGKFYILLRHIIPNTSHLMFINFSLLLIAAIKGEVILTFLGLGLKQGASWGLMIRDSAQQVVNDNFWQIGAATFFMFLLVLAFNIFTDALQDAFDPKHVG